MWYRFNREDGATLRVEATEGTEYAFNVAADNGFNLDSITQVDNHDRVIPS